MKPIRTISRRSFLARVGGASALALAGCTTTTGEPYDPRDDLRREGEGCTDGDSGRYHDRPGNGRHCRFGRTRNRPPRRD